MQVVLDDTERARRLAVMKRRATGLLVAFTGLFVASRLLESRYPWLGVVRAVSEAAMVGGLADWFAVTALFRQPMGLPIPHTAIVPTRKDRIGRSLGNFVQKHFLAREVISRHLSGLQIARRLATWASQPENSRRIAVQVAGGLARAAEVLPGDEVREAIHTSLVSRGRATQVAPILGEVLSFVAADGRHQVLLDRALELVAGLVHQNRDAIRERVGTETPWWVPTVVDEKLYQKIVSGVERVLAEVREQNDHPVRIQFDRALEDFIEGLKHSPDMIERAERAKERLLEAPVVAEISGSLWESTRRSLLRYADPNGPSPAPLERGITAAAEAVLANEALLAEIDAAIINATVSAVERYRPEIAALIERTVADWDAEDATRRIEIAVGRDLQFIRINGTLVGGLVGLLLYLLSELVPRTP
ncbi:MAG: DUF445 domain-containing protein [Gemmatimonadota bacterium]|nr:DUF445 domain-containing protein [Gemmatimonadota bacterium]